jgi:hypothetical protein
MPRDGALTLSDVRDPALSIVCEPCGRRETYDVARLMERHGDAKLTDLLQTLADCPKARSVSIHDRCRAVFERLSLWPSALAKLLPESDLADAQAQMTPEQYAQEYLCSFDAAILGAYYGKLMPTPTQAESERMADGELVMLKRWDLSPIDPQSFDASEPPGRPGTAPVNEAAPVLSGFPQVGVMAVCTNGVWTGPPIYTRVWLRDGAAIAGVTGQTYNLVTADVGAMITVDVTAANDAGSASALSKRDRAD